jgi:general secretion pathway protein G
MRNTPAPDYFEAKAPTPRWPFLFVGIVLLLQLWANAPGPSLRQGKVAQRRAAESQLQTFGEALQEFVRDNGRLPITRQGLDALIHKPKVGPRPKHWKKYLTDVDTIPKDPWGNEYVYQSPGPHGEPFFIASYGADGKPGGKGENADSSAGPSGSGLADPKGP